ncbi:MAG: Hint domain-containing protein [Pseudomonadota bacterium]
MPNIRGTNGNDIIDVTDDNGTLNGTPQGTPIDNIRGRGGSDQITVTNSTVIGVVRGNGGGDDITITGSTVGTLNAGGGADTVVVRGSDISSIALGNGNDTLDFQSTSVSGTVEGGGGTDTLNLPEGTVITDSTFGTITVVAGTSYSLSSGSFTLPSGTIVTYTGFENGAGFPCFTRDTLIATDCGFCPIQNITAGDRVQTVGLGPQTVRWAGRRAFTTRDLEQDPKLRPVRIVASALGQGMPNRDLLVSRQHRMLVQSKIAQRMFGAPEVLIPAIKLTSVPGIYVDHEVQSVEYFHLLFDRHEVIYAEGAPTESLYTGPEALKSLSISARREIFKIFPELADHDHSPDPARLIPRGKLQTRLVSRHLKNNKPLLHTPVALAFREGTERANIPRNLS